MRSRFFGALLVMLSVGLGASAQTSDQLQALKDSLSPEQQGSILQGVLGKGTGTGKQTDNKLKTPETVDQSTGALDLTKRGKTLDGRILRRLGEDPELRPDDTVMIEMTPVVDICNRNGLGVDGQNYGNYPNGGANANGANNGAGVANGFNALGSTSA